MGIRSKFPVVWRMVVQRLFLSKTADGKVYIHINAKQGNQAVRVEVIANYGRKITLSLWQSVKESLIQWPVDFDETSVCLLYGASEQFIYTENPHEGALRW